MLGVLLVALVVLTCLLVAVVAAGALTALATLSAPLSVFLSAVVPYVAGAAILGVLEVVVVVAIAWTLVKRADFDVRGSRLESLADHAERRSDLARSLGLQSIVERSPERKREDALDTLKRRYADGEIDDREFERRLGRLLDDEDVDSVRARRERAKLRE
ncbi:SHOCT domain-containing protein [Halomarina rubra]|uniref:SHOCT domain-containing protein n=1 Tax=Halomarina rubra TaxID=2071873 RepID=A0ABD6AZ27_9EURY|nr:SHOCT domain-containing protein [Halomarina rubra]